MNIWSLNKHNNIKVLLIKMQLQIGIESFCIAETETETGITDNREGGEQARDHLSVVLVHPDQPEVRAYIRTYEASDDLYDIHLEYPRFIENKQINDMLVFNELNAQQILNTLVTHFNVTRLGMAI
jgi:hypothetical protein